MTAWFEPNYLPKEPEDEDEENFRYLFIFVIIAVVIIMIGMYIGLEKLIYELNTLFP